MWGITVNHNFAAIILLLIPVIIYGALHSKKEAFFWYLILTLAFCEGTFDLLGFSASINRLIRDGLITTYFIFKVLNFKFPIRLKYFYFIFGFLVICIFSMLNNGTSIIQLFLFLRRMLIPIFLFWLALNSNIDFYKEQKFIKYIIFLFVIQILFALYKLIIIGVSENYIGSISVRSGSLTTIYTLMGSAVALIYYLKNRNRIYIFLILGFVFFGIMGGKRAILVYLPLLMMLIIFFYTKYSTKGITIKFLINILYILIASFSLIYIIARTNITLNPEQKVWGSFDPEYIISYMDSYNNDDRKGLGRQNAPLVVFALLEGKGTNTILYGFGPGDIISSKFSGKTGVEGDEELLLEKHGVWYGGRTGFLWTLMQIGLLGLLFYVLFFLKVLLKLFSLLKRTKNSLVYLSVISFVIIFFFDFFTYSATFTLSNIFTYIFFISMGLALRIDVNLIPPESNIIYENPANQ